MGAPYNKRTFHGLPFVRSTGLDKFLKKDFSPAIIPFARREEISLFIAAKTRPRVTRANYTTFRSNSQAKNDRFFVKIFGFNPQGRISKPETMQKTTKSFIFR